MSPKRSSAPMQPGDGRQFLFLVSHGLLTPISGIRWACSRLRKTDMEALSDEQRRLVTNIQNNAQRLSKAFGSMVLLARNEDATYQTKIEEIILRDLVSVQAAEVENAQEVKLSLDCPPSLSVRGDRGLLETVVQNILSVCVEGMREPKELTLAAQEEDGMVTLVFTCALELSFVELARPAHNATKLQPVVGGTPGLLLSLTHSLLGFMDGTLEMSQADGDRYRIVMRFPM